MKSFIFYVMLVVLTVLGCNSDSISHNSQVSITNTEWKLVRLKQESVVALKPPITLSFDESRQEIGGFGGCNGFSGSYEQSESNLTFTGILSTEMYCQGKSPFEKKYFSAMDEVQTFKSDGRKLWLLAGDKVILEFKK